MYIPRNPYFSEFTYAYAVTEELIAAQRSPVRVLPIFPSLIEEGQVGFDVLINKGGIPMFLQFKLAYRMTRRATEARDGYFKTPFYRMHLRCTGPTNQHSLLLDLEAEGNEVCYVAPKFHLRRELITAYEKGQIWNRSLQIRPSEIGPQSDKDHHVAFLSDGYWLPFSDEPRRKGRVSDPQAVMQSLREKLDVSELPPLRSSIEHVEQGVMRILNRREPHIIATEGVAPGRILEDLPALSRASYVARHFFDSQFCVAILK